MEELRNIDTAASQIIQRLHSNIGTMNYTYFASKISEISNLIDNLNIIKKTLNEGNLSVFKEIKNLDEKSHILGVFKIICIPLLPILDLPNFNNPKGAGKSLIRKSCNDVLKKGSNYDPTINKYIEDTDLTLEDLGGFLLSLSQNIKEVEEVFDISEGVEYKYTELGKAANKILCLKDGPCNKELTTKYDAEISHIQQLSKNIISPLYKEIYKPLSELFVPIPRIEEFYSALVERDLAISELSIVENLPNEDL